MDVVMYQELEEGIADLTKMNLQAPPITTTCTIQQTLRAPPTLELIWFTSSQPVSDVS